MSTKIERTGTGQGFIMVVAGNLNLVSHFLGPITLGFMGLALFVLLMVITMNMAHCQFMVSKLWLRCTPEHV